MWLLIKIQPRKKQEQDKARGLEASETSIIEPFLQK